MNSMDIKSESGVVVYECRDDTGMRHGVSQGGRVLEGGKRIERFHYRQIIPISSWSDFCQLRDKLVTAKLEQDKEAHRQRQIAKEQERNRRPIRPAYYGADAAFTRKVLKQLEQLGYEGQVAALLFRIQKASSRAKRYRGDFRDDMSCWQGSARSAKPANAMNHQDKAKNSEVRAEQAANKKHRVIKLGLDVHADLIVVVRIVDNSAPQPAQKFTPVRFREWVRTQLAQAEAVHSCYEAGPFGYGLHRDLIREGVQNVVVQPVCLDERHTGVNHDKSDARQLALRLDRYVAGNAQALATVRVPTPEEEQRRVESRQREQLKREVQRVAAQGRGLLLTQGHREKKGWWLEKRWEALRIKLPVWLVDRLEVFRRVLATLTAELRTATRSLEQAAPALRPKGLGEMTCEVIEREVGDWKRFENRRQVGSYTGLCGGVSASGQRTRLLSVTKHGNARLRTALVELAWRLVLWQRQSRLVQKWWGVLGSAKASAGARKKAIVAIARQLAVDLWRWRTGRVRPEELGWQMVGA